MGYKLEAQNDASRAAIANVITDTAAPLVAARNQRMTEVIHIATDYQPVLQESSNGCTGMIETLAETQTSKPSPEVSKAQVAAVRTKLINQAHKAAEGFEA